MRSTPASNARSTFHPPCSGWTVSTSSWRRTKAGAREDGSPHDYSENALRTVVNIATGASRPATPADVLAWEGRNDVAGWRLKASSEHGPGYHFRTHYQ